MRTSSKLSSFVIAAIVLLAAASACLAQTQANEMRGEVSQSAGEHGSELALAVTSKPTVAIERVSSELVSNAGEMKSTTKPKTLSSSIFNKIGDSNQFVKFNANQFQSEQFKASVMEVNDGIQGADSARRTVEFVPSRGQKLPDGK
jgi:hypothetical protein